MANAFSDFDLSARAERALINSGVDSPTSLRALFNKDFDEAIAHMMRVPGCGRSTLNEILEVLAIQKPANTKIKLARFEDTSELLRYIADVDGIDPDKQDANTLRLLLELISRDKIVKEPNGLYQINRQGREEIDQWRMAQRVTLSLTGPRAVIFDLVRALPDSYPYTILLEEEALRNLDILDKVSVDLGS